MTWHDMTQHDIDCIIIVLYWVVYIIFRNIKHLNDLKSHLKSSQRSRANRSNDVSAFWKS